MWKLPDWGWSPCHSSEPSQSSNSTKSLTVRPQWELQGCPILVTFIQHSIGSPGHSNNTRKIIGIHIGKEGVKLSLFADNMILYIENPKDATRMLLKFINKSDKVAEYKINIQKCAVSLYTNNKLSEKQIKVIIAFTTASKK